MATTEDEYFNSIPDLSRKIFFKDKSDFENFMESIDEKLKKDNVPVIGRQLKGASEASIALKTTIPIVDSSFAKPNDYSILSLSAHISNWFDEKYGNKLKFGYALKTVTKIDGDYFVIGIPITFGNFNLIFEFGLLSENENHINIANHIFDLTKHVASRITKEDLTLTANQFYKAMCLSQALERLMSLNMVAEAKRDLSTSAEILVDKINVPGLSKWYSLQFSEKILKVFIECNNESFPFTHDLKRLVKQAKNLGLNNTEKFNWEKIQCKPEVRYDSKLVDIEDAFEAHMEAIMLAGYVIKDILSIKTEL